MSSKDGHVLVVGATGVIGDAIAKRLVADGGNVTLVARPGGEEVPGVVGVDLLDESSRKGAAQSLRPVWRWAE